MPFTPFHMGPAVAAKGLAPRYFSFTMFGLTQILVDLEALYFLTLGDLPVHRFFHTYFGATLIVIAALAAGRPLCEWGLRVWNRMVRAVRLPGLTTGARLTWSGATIGAVLGAYSHVFLDGLTHRDMRPLAPLSDANPMLGAMTELEVYMLCITAGLAGAALMLWMRRRDARRREPLRSRA